MAFHPLNPETYSEASDDQLLDGVRHHGKDIGHALQAEFLRRHLGGLKKAIDEFSAASGIQSGEMLKLARWTMIVAALQIVIAVVVTGWSIHTAKAISAESSAREEVRARAHDSAILKGLGWELAIARAECRAFVKQEPSIEKAMGSPAWIAHSTRLEAAMDTGIFDSQTARDHLESVRSKLDRLNEGNHLMASAAVDALQTEQRAHFLHTNLVLYSDTCRQVISEVNSAEPALIAAARERGYAFKLPF